MAEATARTAQVGDRVKFVCFNRDMAAHDGVPITRGDRQVAKGTRKSGEIRAADVVRVHADGSCDLVVHLCPDDPSSALGPHARIDAVSCHASKIRAGNATTANTFVF